MGAGQIERALSAKYAKPAWLFLTEVRSTTGYAQRERYADAIAISLWPSRGIELIGIEIKVSRGDWLKELADPSKAEVIASMCDRWYVATPKGLIKPEELPIAWGLLEAGEKGIRMKKEAIPTEVKEWPRTFVASILRNCDASARAQEQSRRTDSVLADEYRRGLEAGRAEKRRDVPRFEREIADLKRAITDFEESSGVKISAYNGRVIGAQVRAFMEIRDRWPSIVERFKGQCEEALRMIGALQDLGEGDD